ncbi:MAG: glutamine-hydrolyzing carbamoyl-phosphate synthase small subunit [Spirochaetales bacterium]|nr:glutamine-hydrolyzing carbamoyl-phosphate synthase small subunit [Spirochaetales bacterium]
MHKLTDREKDILMRCFLVLADGTVFPGQQFGAQAPKVSGLAALTEDSKGAGEVVFNTGMCGYHEILTDPSYSGQVVVMTYPHIGNYGCDDEWSENGPEDRSLPRVKAMGFVVRSLYTGPVPEGRITLDAFLKEWDTPGISGVDTRALTLRLRDGGSCNGVIVAADDPGAAALNDQELHSVLSFLHKIPPMEGRNLIQDVGSSAAHTVNEKGDIHFVVVDCGVKANIIEELSKRNARVTVLPHTAVADDILAVKPQGVLFSNGPGDPAVLGPVVDTLKNLIGKVPVFGICLGHQLIGQALGGRTMKMKFGHHGVNHPVRDERTKKVQVTSQNHGFVVDQASLPKEVKVWFTNANDGSVEGIYHESLPVMSCQFHPEAAPGPHDSAWIFQEFIDRASQGV